MVLWPGSLCCHDFLLLFSLLFACVLAERPTKGNGLVQIYHTVHTDPGWFVIKVVFVKFQEQQSTWSKEQLRDFVKKQAYDVMGELEAEGIFTTTHGVRIPETVLYDLHGFKPKDADANGVATPPLLAFSIDARYPLWTHDTIEKTRRQIALHFYKMPVRWSYQWVPRADVASAGYIPGMGPPPLPKQADIHDPELLGNAVTVYHSKPQSGQRLIRVLFPDGQGKTNLFGDEHSIWHFLITAWRRLPTQCTSKLSSVKALFTNADLMDKKTQWTDALDLDCSQFDFPSDEFVNLTKLISYVLRNDFKYISRTRETDNVFFSSRKDLGSSS